MKEFAPPDFESDPSYKKADLHCHSRFSVFKYFRRANTRDCYSPPEDVYRIANERGMSFVTLSDHDSIDGALYLLNKNPDMTDFFIGEEIEAFFPETGRWSKCSPGFRSGRPLLFSRGSGSAFRRGK